MHCLPCIHRFFWHTKWYLNGLVKIKSWGIWKLRVNMEAIWVWAKPKGVFEHTQNAKIQIHPVHAHSLIQAFALHWYILVCLLSLLADSKGPDQTVQMPRLSWAFAVHICSKTCFCIWICSIFSISWVKSYCVQIFNPESANHNCSRWQFYIYIFFFQRKQVLICCVNHLKNNKKKFECRLLQILLGVLRVILNIVPWFFLFCFFFRFFLQSYRLLGLLKKSFENFKCLNSENQIQ